MENFNIVPDKGTFGGSVEVINQNFSLAQQEMEVLQNKCENESARAIEAENSLRQLYNNLQQSKAIPVTSLPATGEAGKIYRLAGTNSYADYMYSESDLTTPIKMAEYNNAIDEKPEAGSDNLVKSGGVYMQITETEKEFSELFRKIFNSVNDGFFITDDKNNIVFKVDSEGLDVAKISNDLIYMLRDVILSKMCQVVEDDGIYISDSSGNTIMKATKDGIQILNYLSTVLNGKTIALLGDSITEQSPYPDNFRKLGKCNVLNFGISGTHLAQRNSNVTNDFISRVPNIPTNVDAVVVMGGTNDFGHSSTSSYGTAHPFGEFTDGANPNKYTFCSGVHNLFRALYNRFTKNKIPVIIVLPLHHGNSIDTHEYNINSDGTIVEVANDATGKTYKEYVEMIERIAKYYSFNIIDAYGQSNINPCIDLTYSSDGLHLNEAGGKKFAKFLITEVSRIINMFNY